MNPIEVVVDATNGVAPWRQVRDQLARLIGSGALPEGLRLPTIRQFARDLGLAPGTIARTYRELELAGMVRTGRARGTFVAKTTGIDRAAALRDLAQDYAAAARALGVDVATAVEAAHAAYETGIGSEVPTLPPASPPRTPATAGTRGRSGLRSASVRDRMSVSADGPVPRVW